MTMAMIALPPLVPHAGLDLGMLVFVGCCLECLRGLAMLLELVIGIECSLRHSSKS